MDWGAVAVGVVPTVGVIVAAIYATRSRSAEMTSATQVALAATAQKVEEVKVKADDDFQVRVLHELQRVQDKYELLNEKHNALAIEHAELRGEVKILREARTALQSENTALKAEIVSLKKRLVVLDEENEEQGRKLSELTGRLAQATGSTP